MFKTQADRKIWAQTDAFDWCVDKHLLTDGFLRCSGGSWEDGISTGDETLAIENLRRYFEQRFHEQNDSCDRSLIMIRDLMSYFDAVDFDNTHFSS
jgi:anaphase-promoting complex subunit 5